MYTQAQSSYHTLFLAFELILIADKLRIRPPWAHIQTWQSHTTCTHRPTYLIVVVTFKILKHTEDAWVHGYNIANVWLPYVNYEFEDKQYLLLFPHYLYITAHGCCYTDNTVCAGTNCIETDLMEYCCYGIEGALSYYEYPEPWDHCYDW